MDKHICKAKSVFDGKWVYGYYVVVPWEDEFAHLIIEQGAEYKGAGEFEWDKVHRVDPHTVCDDMSNSYKRNSFDELIESTFG